MREFFGLEFLGPVLMALKLSLHNPNSTQGYGFYYTESCLLLGILLIHGSDETQHNPNSTHGYSTWLQFSSEE